METTIATQGLPPAGRRVLLVVGDGHLETHALADGATLTVGRDAHCEVRIVHPKISRRHATFHGGSPAEVEDLGSTNGVYLGARRLAPRERCALATGESVVLGPFVVTLIVAPHEDGEGAPVSAAIPVRDPLPDGVPEIVARVARSPVSVLITGETGAGKDVLARTIHALSGRSGQLVAVSCANLAENLLESELFGHERGAFTGAIKAKPGLFELAAGGTLLLDEIGEMPLGLQAKLLRVLDSRQAYRLGGVRPVPLDCRVLAATHRDLAADVAEGRFRRDLYFRVNGLTFVVAPLRERVAAIPALAAALLAEAAAAAGRPVPRLDSGALTALSRHAWPGNVRELRTVLDRALLLQGDGEIRAAHLLFDRLPAPATVLDERGQLVAALTVHGGNLTHVARDLATSRSQVRRMIERLGLDVTAFRARR